MIFVSITVYLLVECINHSRYYNKKIIKGPHVYGSQLLYWKENVEKSSLNQENSIAL